MVMNPMLKKLVEDSAAKHIDLPCFGLTAVDERSAVVHYVRSEMNCQRRKSRDEHDRWFNSYALPRVSVLVRLPTDTRAELLEHFRDKKIRTIVSRSLK